MTARARNGIVYRQRTVIKKNPAKFKSCRSYKVLIILAPRLREIWGNSKFKLNFFCIVINFDWPDIIRYQKNNEINKGYNTENLC